MNDDFGPLITYLPARLYEGKEWYVGFYALDPKTGSLKRIKRKVNRIKSIKDRRRFGRSLADKINRQLSQGWNPFTHTSAVRSMLTFREAVSRYMRMKKGELRGASYTRYQSHVRTLYKWMEQRSDADILAVAFDHKMAIEFMNHVWNSISRNAQTYNNYLAWMKGLCNWMIIQQFITISPFSNIPSKRPGEKSRIIFPLKIRKEVKVYLTENDPQFLIFCYLVFHCLIRPGEALKLKVRDVDTDNQVISISADVSKTKVSRRSTIPNVILDEITDFTDGFKPSNFLFSKNLEPGKTESHYRIVQYRWRKLQNELDLSKDYKIYSLRDSGIIQKLQDGISPEEVMKQAGHSSLKTTTIYVNHANPKGSDQVKTKTSHF